MTSKPFDPTKPVKMDGSTSIKVEILPVRMQESAHALLAQLTFPSGRVFIRQFNEQTGISNKATFSNLINIPEKHVRWVNVYDENNETAYSSSKSKEMADERSKGNRGRIACIKIEFEEGEGL